MRNGYSVTTTKSSLQRVRVGLRPDLRESERDESRHSRIETERVTHLEHAVPRTCAKSHSILTDTQTTDSVLVSSEYTDSFSLERIPHVAVEVVVTSEEHSTGN